jgi:hypothetical protein
MSWRGTSGNYKAHWTGYRPNRHAGRYTARPCPRLVIIRPVQNTRETSEKCQGNGVRCGAPVKTGEHWGVNVLDNEANRGGRVTQGIASEWLPWHE